MIFNTIIHDVRIKFGLSLAEYCIVDSVCHLSKNVRYGGWCVQSKDDLADALGCSRRSVFTAIKKMITSGLIEKNELGHLRTTDKWNNQFCTNGAEIAPGDMVQKLHPDGAEIAPNNKSNNKKIYNHPSKEKIEKENIDEEPINYEKSFDSFLELAKTNSQVILEYFAFKLFGGNELEKSQMDFTIKVAREFFEHWTAPLQKGRDKGKMKGKTQDTFQWKSRANTWCGNIGEWKKPKGIPTDQKITCEKTGVQFDI